MPNKYVQVEEISTFVHYTGRTTLPERPPELARGEVVLCLHAEGGNGQLFQGVLAGLTREHSPLAFDQPGHGRSAGLDSLASIEEMAAFTRAFASRLGLRPAVLLGHSMGALVALQCALDEPSRVRALVLCAAGAGLAYSDADLEAANLVSEGKQRRAFDPRLFAPGASPELMRTGFFEALKTDPRAFVGDLRACREWNGLGRLASLRIPTLLLQGESEPPAARRGAEAIARHIPGARLREIPKAAHMLPLEAPEAVAAAVADFLRGLA